MLIKPLTTPRHATVLYSAAVNWTSQQCSFTALQTKNFVTAFYLNVACTTVMHDGSFYSIRTCAVFAFFAAFGFCIDFCTGDSVKNKLLRAFAYLICSIVFFVAAQNIIDAQVDIFRAIQ